MGICAAVAWYVFSVYGNGFTFLFGLNEQVMAGQCLTIFFVLADRNAVTDGMFTVHYTSPVKAKTIGKAVLYEVTGDQVNTY